MAAMSLNDLTKSLRDGAFEARSDEALQQEAETRLSETYDSMRSAAQQRQATVDDAYARELQSLTDTLASGQAAISQEVSRANAGIDDYINTRSMQRTSYGAAAKGSVQQNMQKAAQVLAQQYNTASSGVENNRILLAQQLAGTLAQYDKDYLTDVQAYIDSQKQLDYDRKAEADAAYNELQMQLFELGKTGSSGGGSRKSSSGSSAPISSPPPDSSGLFDLLGGGGSSVGIPVVTGYTKGGTPIVSSYYDPKKVTANQYKK